jgi:hypothetical protein
MPPLFLAIAVAWLALVPASLAQSKKPPVPPGRDPGGVAIALLSTGIDYTLPHIAGRLARDGEGELIGWDVEDRDRLPFGADRGDGQGTAVTVALLGRGDARLVPVRVNPDDPVSLARGIAFVAQTPARVAVVARWSLGQESWEPLRQAATHFKGVLIIAPAEVGAGSAPPKMLGLDNVLAVAPAMGGGAEPSTSPSHQALAAAGKAAGLLIAREPKLDAAALKRRLVESGGDPMWRPHK